MPRSAKYRLPIGRDMFLPHRNSLPDTGLILPYLNSRLRPIHLFSPDLPFEVKVAKSFVQKLFVNFGPSIDVCLELHSKADQTQK